MALGSSLLRDVLEALLEAPDPAHVRPRAVRRLYLETGPAGLKARRLLRGDAVRRKMDGIVAANGGGSAPSACSRNSPSVRTLAAVFADLRRAGRGDLIEDLTAHAGGPAVRARRLLGPPRPGAVPAPGRSRQHPQHEISRESP